MATAPNALQIRNHWKLADAKAHLSEVVRQAADGPQMLTVRGTEQAVVLSIADYRKLGGADDRPSLREFFESLDMPELNLERGSDHIRDIEIKF